ncbi:unnamed protein product, partial [marine sediment metagenome]
MPCSCTQPERDKKSRSRLQRYSGLELELLKKMAFDNFDWKRVNLPPEQRENIKEAYRLALDFAKSPQGWLVFIGETGCGKTHLAAAIANYCLKEGQPVKFEVVPDFLDHLRLTFSPESPVTYDQLFEEVKNAPLLILDDFGEQSTTPWAEEAVIGSLLIDGTSIHKIAAILQPPDFHNERNSLIYGACLSLYERDEAIDQITVAQELDRQGKLEACGGAA